MTTVIPAVLDHCADLAPDVVALITPDGVSVSLEEVRARSQAMARGLRANGVGPGDRVGILLTEADVLAFAAAFVAVHRVGGCAVICLSTLPPERAADQLAHQQVSVVITRDARCVPAGAGHADPDDLRLPGPDLATLAGPHDLAQILFTSGTTGPAKAVGATHANLLAHRQVPTEEQVRRADRYLNVIPLGGNSCQTKLIDAVTGRLSVVWLTALDLEALPETVARHRPTSTVIVPAVAQGLTAMDLTGADLSSLRTVGLTGAPTVPAIFDRLASRLPNTALYNIYGTTESWPLFLAQRYDRRRPTAIGRLPEGESVRILDEDGREVGPGKVGVVHLRIAPVSGRPGRGYVRPGTLEFEAGQDWQDTGDLGYADDDGYLYLVDRVSRMIPTAAGPVSPLSVEAALIAIPEVIEATVFPVESGGVGPQPAAAVALRAPLTDQELLSRLASTLPTAHLPVAISRWPRIPLTYGCKPDVPRMVARLGAATGAPTDSPTPDDQEKKR